MANSSVPGGPASGPSRRRAPRNLRQAHRGYIYQDLVAAFLIAQALIEPTDRIIVDRKAVEGDRIDDLEVVVATRRVRRQIKFSANPERRLTGGDFRNATSSLRIDELALTHARHGNAGASEYRLCATWNVPGERDDLWDYLEEIGAAPTIPGSATRTFRLKGQSLWPPADSPRWDVLATDARLDRGQFIAFCDRFIIELLLPGASLDFMAPGPIEGALLDLLSRRVGVGRYPNDDMRVEDAAAQAVFLAETSRAAGASLRPDDIATRLRLRRDFGHVAQAFPLDRELAVGRPGARADLLRHALGGALQIVTGPPGAGKSWELTQLADDLRAHGAVVARHYCYLDPSDDLGPLRITSNAFFGNLIYELTTQAPELREQAHIGFAADSQSLERLLDTAHSSERHVVLVIDGLDHITRVRADAGSVSANQSDIIAQLAAIDLPSDVSIVIGSQPGDHLDPLRSAWALRLVSQTLQPWDIDELVALGRAHGVDRVLQSLDFDDAQIKQTLEALAGRAEGNPLYARALSVELCLGAQAGSIASPLSWLRSDEGLGDGLAAYYTHLYEGEVSDSPIVADVLGVIDFAVTCSGLQDIVGPLVRGHVEPALRILQPVLSDASAQGGFRIFHESFRRFIREKMAQNNRSVANALSPVIDWLRRRGFFTDALSFRFLLPALARAGYVSCVWDLVDRTFVRKAITSGHSLEPILANIAVIAEMARRSLDWPMLVRILELRRAALTAFDPSQNDWEEYLEGFASVFGYAALTERLLFDGRPTLDRNLGLFACDLVDRQGGVPPWREYLSMPEEPTNRNQSLFDAEAALEGSEALTLQVFRGRLRLPMAARTLRWFYQNLHRHGNETKPVLLRGFARIAADVYGAEVIAPLAIRIAERRFDDLSTITRCSVVLGVAEAAKASGDSVLCQRLVALAARLAPDSGSLIRCLELGAALPQELSFAIKPELISIGVGPDRWDYQAAPVRQWVAEIRVAARRAGGNPNVFVRERERVAGVGWYRSWLAFVMDIALIEANESPTDDEVVAAFEGLERDAAPFIGDPRACDISTIRDVIAESVSRALSLVRTPSTWSRVLPIIASVSDSTLYTLQGEDSGAIPTGTLLHLLLRCVATRGSTDLVLQAIEDTVQGRRHMHYPTLAEFMIVLARARQAAGYHDTAVTAWSDGIGFITGYGWRKDSTVYELLECFDAFAAIAPERALTYAADLQDVVDAVVRHTDGKGTKTALNGWLQSLLAIAPVAGGFLFARSTAPDGDAIGWRSEEALRLIAASLLGHADPGLLDRLLLSIPLREYTDHLERADIEQRFAPIGELARSDTVSAASHFRDAFATLCNDTRLDRELRTFAYDMIRGEGVVVVAGSTDNENAEPQEPTPDSVNAGVPNVPPMNPVASACMLGDTLAELYRGLRSIARAGRYDSARNELWPPVIAVLGDRLLSTLQRGEGDAVEQVLYFFARDAGVEGTTSEPHPLALLAARLRDGGWSRYASLAYALAYTSTRSDWLGPFAGTKHHDLIDEAIALDRDTAQHVYASQVITVMTRNRYLLDVTADVLRRLSEWADADTVESAWQEVFGALSERTPGVRSPGRLARLSEDDLQLQWSFDEVAISLLLARVSEPRIHYKLEALLGVIEAIRQRPKEVIRPLRWWLSVETPRTAQFLIAAALIQTEVEPYEITRGLVGELEALVASPSSLIRNRARSLLERIGRHPVNGVPADRPVDCLTIGDGWREVQMVGGWAALRTIKELFHEQIERAERRAHAALPDRHTRRNRAELMFGMHFDAKPRTAAVLCETEELFRELDDGLAEGLQQDGTGADPALLERSLTPDLSFYLGRAASRCPRPPWTRPVEGVVGIREALETVGEEDPQYAGWTRIALIEHEYPLPAGSHDHTQPEREVTRFSAIVALPLGVPVPANAWPFLECDEVPEEYGALVGASREMHWLGYPWRLEPPLSLVWEARLKRSRMGEPISWVDAKGQPMIALRSWRVVRSDPTAEPATLVGCDLLSHPSATARLRALHGTLRELTTTGSERLRGPIADKNLDEGAP